MRTIMLCLVISALAAAENLVPDNLFGQWVVDERGLTKDQQEAAAAARKVEGFGATFTLRTARVVFATDAMTTGMWRLDEATPTTAVLVIQPKGADEQRYHLTLEKGRLTIDECPGRLPMTNTRAAKH
jgi:hypothetical protein